MVTKGEKRQPVQGEELAAGKKILNVEIDAPNNPPPNHPIRVSLTRTAAETTPDQGLWEAIRNRVEAIGFKKYKEFISGVLCENNYTDHGGVCAGVSDEMKIVGERRNDLSMRPAIYGVDAYNLLRLATEVFLLINAGVVLVKKNNGNTTYALLDPELFNASEASRRLHQPGANVEDIVDLLKNYFGNKARLPYLDRIAPNLVYKEEGLPYCEKLLQHRLTCPSMLELIWSYWHEEGMLAQTINAVALRFQNLRLSERDPLVHLELDPLRPLNNLLWGYIQNEHNRLTLPRRAHEYDHHYGITLYGKVVPRLRSADSRSKFLEAFHNLLHRASQFYREDADTTVVADGFPLLNALKEVHLILAEGAHNQYGDLPWTARVEMLIEQWMLARPEMGEFLRGRHMVPYKEEWMGAVDAMRKLQGWGDVTVTHFGELAIYGEQVLLSVRYGDWINVNDERNAKNWARYWKPEVQGYVHAYRAAVGKDLTKEPVDAAPPWVHFKRQEEKRAAHRA